MVGHIARHEIQSGGRIAFESLQRPIVVGIKNALRCVALVDLHQDKAGVGKRESEVGGGLYNISPNFQTHSSGLPAVLTAFFTTLSSTSVVEVSTST